MTATQSIKPVLRSDYQPPTYWIENVELEFDLDPRETLVTARISVRRNSQQSSNTLELAGENLKLQSVSVDGKRLDENQYQLHDDGMTLLDLPESCLIETKVLVSPVTNKSLSGLYQTSGNYCTQ